MITYEGPLYGKLGRRYIKLKHTSKDFDDAEKIISLMREEIERLRLIAAQVSFNETMEKAISESRL